MTRRSPTLFLMVSLFAASPAGFAQPATDPVILGFAREYRIEMLIGQYDPVKNRWLPNNISFQPPDPQSPITLFGPTGRLEQVYNKDTRTTSRMEQPWDWNVDISSWTRNAAHVALAIPGKRPEFTRKVQAVPLDDPIAVRAVVEYLKQHHLDVPHPRITQVLRGDLHGDGRSDTLICANSDNAQIAEDASAPIYAISLWITENKGAWVTYPLDATQSNKPPYQNAEEYQRRHGRWRVNHILAVTSLAGGVAEIFIDNDNRDEGPEIDVYTLKGGRVSHLLSAYKHYF